MDIRITPFSNFEPLTKSRATHQHSTNYQKKSRSIKTGNSLTSPKRNVFQPAIKPKLSIKITSNTVQPSIAMNKKGILLYQQTERNKLYANGTELINRFNFKV